MANQVDKQVILDGFRNASVKITGSLDSSDHVMTPAVALGDFVTNDPTARLVGFRVNCVTWALSDPLQILLEWNGATPQLIAALAGQHGFERNCSGGLQPDQARSGFDGAINLRTLNYPSGTKAAFTVVLDLVKLYK